jgi:hypothetical protein
MEDNRFSTLAIHHRTAGLGEKELGRSVKRAVGLEANTRTGRQRPKFPQQRRRKRRKRRKRWRRREVGGGEREETWGCGGWGE